MPVVTGIAAAVLLTGWALSSIPRTVNSAPYSEKETEPQITETQPIQEEETVPELRVLEETEPTEPVIPETEPESAPEESVPADGEEDWLLQNTMSLMARVIEEDFHMAVKDKDDFIDPTNYRRTVPREEGWICPLVLDTYVTSPYGYRWHPVYGTYRMHKGVDLDSDWYDHIVAPRSGTVIATGYSSSAGYYVKIDHGNGFVSEYFHLADYFVYVGQDVKQGELIALVGSTGTSTGAHLHYGMLYEGSYVNPEDYVVFE